MPLKLHLEIVFIGFYLFYFFMCGLPELTDMLFYCLIWQNIVHGDIKPDNLLITSFGTVKIGDFSVSQVVEVRECY